MSNLFRAIDEFDNQIKPQINKMKLLQEVFHLSGKELFSKYGDAEEFGSGMETIFQETINSLREFRGFIGSLYAQEREDQ